jgi:two-component system, OmpR family, response regulator
MTASLSPVTGSSVLVAEDDLPLRDVLLRGLAEEGFAASGVGTASELMSRALEGDHDLLVVDIGLPDADGRDACQALRARGVQTPVLFLTARDALTDRLSGFRAGGDDYVTKPFALDEVIARLRSLLRRSVASIAVELGAFRLDPVAHAATAEGVTIVLTPTEFRLTAALAAQPGAAVRRRDLVRAAWPHEAIVHENTLDVYVARLRRKLAALPAAPTITTVRGVGYCMR